MTEGFSYAPFDSSKKNLRLSRELKAVLRDVQSNSRGSSPQENATQALVKLIEGKPREAVAELEEAVEAAPDNASFLSDLATAYLENAQKNREPYSFVKALENAEKAVVLNPKLLEARFNRALALESLFLDGEARLAWQEYQRLDLRSHWSVEAHERSRTLPSLDAAAKSWNEAKQQLDTAVLRRDAALVKQLSKRFPQAIREYAEEELLGEWAINWLGGRSAEAQRILALVSTIGAALAESNGEHMVSDAVEAIEEAAIEKDKGRRVNFLAKGHKAYHEGLGLYSDGQIAEAANRFKESDTFLGRGKSPFAAWAVFRRAVCEMQKFRYSQALALLDCPQTGAARASYKGLAGRSCWLAGLIHGIQARPAESLAACHKAKEFFKILRETESSAMISAMIADNLRISGDVRGAWHFYVSALRDLRNIREPVRRGLVLEGSSINATERGELLAALAFQQEAANALKSSSNAIGWIYYLRRRALIEIRAGRREAARRDLAEARDRLVQVDNEDYRDSLLGDILAVEAQLYPTQDPVKAVATLSEAINIYRGTKYQKQLGSLYARRARAHLALGRLREAELDFRSSILAIGQQHNATEDRMLRTYFLTESRSIFNDMVLLQARLGLEESALSYAEKGRVQIFLEQAPTGTAGFHDAPSISEIIRLIPRDVALIEYLVLDGQVLIWVVRKDSVKMFSYPISRIWLVDQVEELRRDVFKRSGAIGGEIYASQKLFELLVGNIRAALHGIHALVIIPDRELYGVPFAALQDLAGRYLVDQYTISVCPSASLYVQALERARRLRSGLKNAPLILGGPTLDSRMLPYLPVLPLAQKEALQVARLYPGAQALIGAEATKRRFLAALDKYDILHFAGHAIVNRASPRLSFLALAPTATKGDSGILYASELYGRPSVAARLVVLSGCNTITDVSHESEGIVGLARPFLASGVPAVIGSLWRVDERATMVLFVEFHRSLRDGADVDAALRQAQFALRSSSDTRLSTPASWAGFQLIGAGVGGFNS